MCLGAAAIMGIATGAAALGNTITGMSSQQAQYDAQMSAYNQQLRSNEIAIANYNSEMAAKGVETVSAYEAANEEVLQAQEKATSEKNEIMQEANRKAAAQKAAGSYAGLADSTIARMVNEVNLNASQDVDTANKNLENRTIAAQMKKNNAWQSSYMPGLNLIDPAMPSEPNFMGSLVSGFTNGVLGSYSAYTSTNAQLNRYQG